MSDDLVRRQERIVAMAQDRVRRPALLLAFAGVVQVALAMLGGIVPPLVVGGLVASSGGGQDAWIGVGVFAVFVLAAVVINIVGGAVITLGGTSLLRLRSRTWTWVAVALALPIAVVGATVQMAFVPLAGLVSGVASTVLTLVAAVLAAKAMQDPVVHAAFETP